MTVMNLPELLQSQPDLATLRGLALILSPALHTTLEAVQAQLPARQFRAQAYPLTDGRWFLPADLLSEIGPHFGPAFTMRPGLYQDGFGQLPQEALPLVEVLPMAEALALRPEPVLES